MPPLRTHVPVEPIAAEIAARVPALLAESGVPGASVALVRDGEVAWAGGFGLAETSTSRPVTPDAVFEAASITKPMFAYAVLALCDEGALELDRPLAAYVHEPDLDGDPRAATITARQVLSHTTGLPNWRREVDDDFRTYFLPGARYSYSGEGFQYLRKVVEAVTGESAVALMDRFVLGPCEMARSDVVWPARRGPFDVAIGYERDGTPREERDWPEFNAAASLHGTPSDIARFMTRMMLADQGPVAPIPAWLDLTLTPAVPVNDSVPWRTGWPHDNPTLSETLSWGLGWGLEDTSNGADGGRWFWHWGDNGVYRNFAIGSREQRAGVVVMTNGRAGYELWGPVLEVAIGGDHPALAWVAAAYSSQRQAA